MKFPRFCALSLASTGLFAAVPTMAEEQASDVSILVTATKKAVGEDLQGVPAAINAYGAEELASRHVQDLQGLTHAAPGVSLDQIGTFRGVANFAIRGLGVNSSIVSIDPAVGVFVDGVYQGVNSGAVFDLFDVGSIELLRGPQGVLFGRNTTGGAVLVNTADPEDAWSGSLRGSFDGPVDGGRGVGAMSIRGTINAPLGENTAFRLAAMHVSDGGYFRNLANGGALGKAETYALRGGLSHGTGALRIVAKGEYFSNSGDGAVTQNHGLYSRESFDLGLDNEGFIRARSWSGTLRADYDLGHGTLTNIAGWRRYMQRTNNDIDSTPSFLFHSGTGLNQQQWSDELRYAGSFGGLDLTAGGYIFHQSLRYTEDRTIPPGAMQFGGGRLGHNVYGLFASADVPLTATVKLGAGLRWSRDVKDAALTFIRVRPACSVISGTCPVTGERVAGEPNGLTDRRSWSNWAPKVSLNWTPDDQTLAYLSWSRAFRSGGYNVRIATPASFLAIAAAAGSPAFGLEKVDSFEAGLKWQLANKRATVNLAAYQSNVANMQREIIQASASAGTAQSIYNTADTRIRGFEAEVRYALTPRLSLGAQLAHIDARYQWVLFDISGNGSIGTEDYALEVPRAPRWSWGFGLKHDLPLGATSSLSTRLDFQHRSRLALTDSNVGWNRAGDFLDGSLTWRAPLKGVTLSLYGRNLLEQVQFAFETPVGFGAGPFSDGNNRAFDPSPAVGTFAPLSKGRVVGVELGVAF